jgi:hypothetical protein
MTITKQELIQVLNSLPDDVDLQEIDRILSESIETATTQQRRLPSPDDHMVKHDISTQDQCVEVTSPANRDHRWYEGLSLYVDWEILKGRIVVYKIKWFNGTWSGWYVPGVNDIDHKFNDSNWPGNMAKHNTMRRMWSYFYDHEHTYIICKPKSSI